MSPPRFAAGKVALPDEEFSARERMGKTIPGVGDCPQRDGCMLEVHRLLEDMRKELSGELRELRTGVNALLQAKGIRNMDSTPAGRGTINIEVGPAKFRGRWWVIAMVLITLGAMAAGAYVLAQWGRPTVTQTRTS